MAFDKEWTCETSPVGTDAMSTVDDKMRYLGYAIRERAGLQHITYADETGKTDVWEHKPGECNVVYVGTKATFPTPESANSGCMAIATDENNTIYYWNGGAWTSIYAVVAKQGDWMLSSVTTPRTGWTNVSATYSNKFMRINTTPLTTGGADTHTHGVGSYASASHTHTLDVGNKGGDLSDGVQSDGTYMWNEGADLYYGNTVKITTVSGGGAAITGTSASSDNVPAYVQVCIFQKD
jgi:hypothetical protein